MRSETESVVAVGIPSFVSRRAEIQFVININDRAVLQCSSSYSHNANMSASKTTPLTRSVGSEYWRDASTPGFRRWGQPVSRRFDRPRCTPFDDPFLGGGDGCSGGWLLEAMSGWMTMHSILLVAGWWLWLWLSLVALLLTLLVRWL